MANDCVIQCGPSCAWIFSRLRVTPQINGGTLVEWGIHPRFRDPLPHSFQLQIGKTGLDAADDWVDVGSPVIDAYSALDATKREYGQLQMSHYRVILSSPGGQYASAPQSCLGNLSRQDWTKMKAIVRMENFNLWKTGQQGYLLKRRLSGTPCPTCLDYLTQEITDPDCGVCYGTGIEGGYHSPVSCFYVATSPWGIRSSIDQTNPNNEKVVVAGRMLNTPQVFSYDVWVDQDTDQRWFIHSIKALAEVRGVPVVLSPVEMRLADFSDPIYKFAVL